jgi:hypothetical protein
MFVQEFDVGLPVRGFQVFYQRQIKSNKGVNELKHWQSLFLLLFENRINMCRYVYMLVSMWYVYAKKAVHVVSHAYSARASLPKDCNCGSSVTVLSRYQTLRLRLVCD